MKAFRFSLNRVLDWRQTELTTEEAKLENLRAEQRAARTDLEDLPRLRAEAQAKVSGTPVLQGRDLAGLESFHQWTLSEERRLTTRIAQLQRAIEDQILAVTEARRKVRLIERLKERRYQHWQTEVEREIETAAGESAISQWRRLTGSSG